MTFTCCSYGWCTCSTLRAIYDHFDWIVALLMSALKFELHNKHTTTIFGTVSSQSQRKEPFNKPFEWIKYAITDKSSSPHDSVLINNWQVIYYESLLALHISIFY